MNKEGIKVVSYLIKHKSDYVSAGEELNRKLRNNINTGVITELDFSEYDDLGVTKFLNKGIGELYKDYNSNELSKKLKVKNISSTALTDLKDVIEVAKKRFEEKNN